MTEYYAVELCLSDIQLFLSGVKSINWMTHLGDLPKLEISYCGASQHDRGSSRMIDARHAIKPKSKMNIPASRSPPAFLHCPGRFLRRLVICVKHPSLPELLCVSLLFSSLVLPRSKLCCELCFGGCHSFCFFLFLFG
jgi:hypothetical protein